MIAVTNPPAPDFSLHTHRLARYLSLESKGPTETRRFAESLPPSLNYRDFDGKTINARELLIAEGTVANTAIVPTEILATVLEGAEPIKCMRDVLPTFAMRGQILRVPCGDAGMFAPVVAEGAEIPILDQAYTHYELRAIKYGVRPMITQEAVDDLMFDVVAAEIRKAGYRLENTLNQLVLRDLIRRANRTVDLEGANPISDLASATSTMMGAGYTPDAVVFSPVGYATILGALTSIHSQLQDETIRSGSIGRLLGLDVKVCSVPAKANRSGGDDDTADWGEKTVGMVLAKSAAGSIGIRKDITVANYADTIRQMQGITVSARWAVGGLDKTHAVALLTAKP